MALQVFFFFNLFILFLHKFIFFSECFDDTFIVKSFDIFRLILTKTFRQSAKVPNSLKTS